MPGCGYVRIVLTRLSKVYCTLAAVLVNRKAATANSFVIIISWAGGIPVPIPILCFGSSLQRDLRHFHNISREWAGLVQCGIAGNLITVSWVVNFPNKSRSLCGNGSWYDEGLDLQSNPATWDSRRTIRNRSRDHFNGRIVDRRFHAISGQLVRPSRSCGCRCRRAKNRSLDFSQRATFSQHVQPHSPGRRGCQARGCCVRPARWRGTAGVSGYRVGHSRTQGAYRRRDRFHSATAAGSDQRARKERSGLHIPQWFRAEVYRPIASAHLQRAAVLFSRHYGLRHPAPLRRRSRQEGFSGNAKSIRQGLTRYISPVSFCATFAAALRPVISLLSCSKRCRASFWLSSTNRIAASFVIGPAITGMEVSPIVSST